MFLLQSWKNQYGEVAQFEGDSSEEDLFFKLKIQKQQKRRRLWSLGLTILNVSVFLFSLVVLISSRSVLLGKNAALKLSSFYSPVLNDITIPTFSYTINGSLFADENPGLARLDPSTAVDEAWTDFDKTRTLVISREDVVKLGKDPELVAKFEDEYWGFGDDAYMAQMDVFHQIHCLNTLRKIAFEDFYGPVEPREHSTLWWHHIKHCTDILLQNIMCHGTTDLVTMNWMETQDGPFPDFSVNHQCRDFQTLVDYRDAKSVDWDKWLNMKKPKGVQEVPAPKQYYELFGSKTGESHDLLQHDHDHDHGHGDDHAHSDSHSDGHGHHE